MITIDMPSKPKYPWRLDTNERYREVTRTVMGLATASLFLPVFLAREFLGVKSGTSLESALGISVFCWAWGLFGLSIFSGIVFHYLSAKWVRLAWGKEATVLGCKASENFVEKTMEVFFWATALAFLAGLVVVLVFFLNAEPLKMES